MLMKKVNLSARQESAKRERPKEKNKEERVGALRRVVSDISPLTRACVASSAGNKEAKPRGGRKGRFYIDWVFCYRPSITFVGGTENVTLLTNGSKGERPDKRGGSRVSDSRGKTNGCHQS